MPPIGSQHSWEVCIHLWGLTRGSCFWPLLLLFLEVKSEFRGASQALRCHPHTDWASWCGDQGCPSCLLSRTHPCHGAAGQAGAETGSRSAKMSWAPVPIKGDGLDATWNSLLGAITQKQLLRVSYSLHIFLPMLIAPQKTLHTSTGSAQVRVQ